MYMSEFKLRCIIDHFGWPYQVIKLGEEVGELFKAILNYENGYKVTDSELIGELADCHIMLRQVELQYNIDGEELQRVIDMKIDRTFDKYNIEY